MGPAASCGCVQAGAGSWRRSGRSSAASSARRREVEGAAQREDELAVELELGGEQVAQLRRHRGRHLETNRRAHAPAAPEAGFDRGDQIVGLALRDGELGVARHAEGSAGDDLHPREEHREVRRDHLLDGHEATRGNREPAREDRRHLHAREAVLARAGVADDDREREREARDVREGMGRIDRERRQDREDLLVEEAGGARQLVVPEVVEAAQLDPRRRELRDERFQEQLFLARDQLARRSGRICRSCSPATSPSGDATFTPESSCAASPATRDLEELVEVVRGDREEADAFEQRSRGVLGEAEHAPIEAEPGELAIQEPRRSQHRLRGNTHPRPLSRFGHRGADPLLK